MRASCLSRQNIKLFSQFHTIARRAIHSRNKPYNAAVLGGGITGLTTAFRLAQDPNCTNITLYERSPRLGGWLQSETLEVEGGQVIFEYGPRTLRTIVPSCLPLLDLLLELDLESQILITNKTSVAASNRYVFYPDHLVRMPMPYPDAGVFTNVISNGKTIFMEPLFEGFVKAVLTESLKPPREDKFWSQDESVASFVARRMSPGIADNLVSSLYHGIYAGDIDRLSAQTLLGPYRDLEKTEGQVIKPLLNIANSKGKFVMTDDILALYAVDNMRPQAYWQRLSRLVKGSSILTLKNGIAQLAERLVNVIRDSGKVEILTSSNITSLGRNQQTSDLMVQTGEHPPRAYNRIIATVPAPELAMMIQSGADGHRNPPRRSVMSLTEHNYAVSVMVVNLYYSQADLIPFHGFGYLIPRSIPYQQNPERALGVIFGSDSAIGQDTVPGTKFTVMLGGHWWDNWLESDYPDHDEATLMARSLLERHLGIKATPVVAKSQLQRNAIPQYTVGHLARMEEISRAVQEEFNHRLTLAGSWYGGIGVNDCIRQAYLAASYGTGAQRLDDSNKILPWIKSSYRDWDMEGGLVASPQRWFLGTPADIKYFNG